MRRGEGDHREDSIEMIFLGQDWAEKSFWGRIGANCNALSRRLLAYPFNLFSAHFNGLLIM